MSNDTIEQDNIYIYLKDLNEQREKPIKTSNIKFATNNVLYDNETTSLLIEQFLMEIAALRSN